MRVRRASGATEGDPAREHLARLARTAVAAGHGGLLTVAGGPSVNVGYLDDDGEPVIVCATSAPALRGCACLAVRAGQRQRVVLGGRLVHLDRRAQPVADLLAAHAPCVTEAMQAAPVRLTRLAVDAVRFEDERGSFDVSCSAFVTAEPDLWAAFGPAVAEHLSNVHGDVLGWMAARHLPHERVVAAAARRMRRTAIDLDVITPFGASRVEVALSAAPADPRELCALLRELTMDGPDGVGPAER